MANNDLGKALHAYNVGLPYIRAGYSDCIFTLELQVTLLAHQLPYSIQSEIEINSKVMNYINLCIRYMNILKPLTGKLDFPIEHDLLRLFRDQNHHNAEDIFKPTGLAGTNKTEFYIYPILFSH